MPAAFDVWGPYEIPNVREPRAKLIDTKAIKGFLRNWECRDKVGVYIFFIRKQRGGLLPWYVGRTFRSFAAEAFTAHKLHKYDRALVKAGGGNPLMLLLCKKGRGATPKAAIRELETQLINTGFNVNDRLENDRGIRTPKFQILGIGKRGAPSAEIRIYRRVFQV